MRAQLDGVRPGIGLPTDLNSDPVQIRVSNLMMSQSGAAFPADYDRGNKLPIIPRELFGQIDSLEVTGLSPSGTRFKNTFEIGADGRLMPKASTTPLGHVPYELALIGKDGSRYTTVIDISPKAQGGNTHRGYDPLPALTFTLEKKPLEQFTAGRFMLSQSGAVFPQGYGERNQEAFIPNNNGFFTQMIVKSTTSSTSNTFDIRPDGQVEPKASTHPLGDVPYEITLIGKDGSQYSSPVDVSSRAIGKTTHGYETVADLVFTRRQLEVDTRTEAPLSGADSGFVSSGGGAPKSSFGSSPLGAFASRGKS
jgi:hypothetical protein